jgi:hypothetical protein
MPIKAILNKPGVLERGASDVGRREPPMDSRPARGSLVGPVKPQIRELLAQWPTMPATVIAERICWEHSLTVLKDRVRVLRPLFIPPDSASRTAYAPGELAQCDVWLPPADVPLGAGQMGRPPVLVMLWVTRRG